MNALFYIFNIIGNVLVGILVVRFLLQLFRADFQNPVSQSIVKLTNPVVLPLRKIVPGFKKMDLASLLAAFMVQIVVTLIATVVFMGASPSLSRVLFASTFSFIDLVLGLYFMLIFLRVILSWVSTDMRNPIVSVIYSLTEPILAPARRIVPMLGNLDISPILVIMAIGALRILLTQDLARWISG